MPKTKKILEENIPVPRGKKKTKIQKCLSLSFEEKRILIKSKLKRGLTYEEAVGDVQKISRELSSLKEKLKEKKINQKKAESLQKKLLKDSYKHI